MNDERATLEVIAPTIEEAIEKGLADLGLPQEAVDVEVLDEGRGGGLFGLGGRQARVRLIVKDPEAESQPTSAAQPADLEEDKEDVLNIARETVEELLDKMGVETKVTASYGEKDPDYRFAPIIVDITGDDLSILIGRRAETLNALQYITKLILGKELNRAVPLMVDVEGYRVRRERNLRKLANRMADQAIKSGRRQVLEPMSASERRIIHIELRENDEVETESAGEDPRRKVAIIPT